ncbi:MAG: hypothetical protein HY343_08810 [Lentisphaerae bacterium]|nr:hypothetical protein [Lentisphaerota bacterium]
MNIETTDSVDTSALLRLIDTINNDRLKTEPRSPEAQKIGADAATTVHNLTGIQQVPAETEHLPALGRYVNVWA